MPKGNHQATGKKPKRGPELVSRARYQLIKAFDLVEEKGLTVAELLARDAEENPMKFMELVSKYCPRDMAITDPDGNQFKIEHTVKFIRPDKTK